MSDPVPRINTADVGVSYGSRVALSKMDLDLAAGVHGLLGPNGAGKTTLMRVLATVLAPRNGSVEILGFNALDRTDRKHIRAQLGYLPQAFGYYPRFTVQEFVEYFAWLKQVPKSAVPTAVTAALELVGLTERAGSTMKSLSGGMLRRAGVAQALVNNPKILLLDEPTAGLDPEQRMDFRALLRAIGKDNCVVVSTHLVEDVATACTSVRLMDAGAMVYSGTSQDLIEEGAGGTGDTPIERGYTTVLRLSRADEQGTL